MENKSNNPFELKKIINTFVGVLVSVLAIYFFVNGIDVNIFSFHIKLDKLNFNEMYHIVKEIDTFYLLLSIIISQLPFFF